ncbi:MAG: HEAT repeat domain-containing protein [Deltaproteobacteria bacterium]|nr:HEAT repeat domain-containing protein [Deltaproteobacteria bacterium]
MDSIPTTDQILKFAPDPVPHLRGLALSTATDFGVRLRAIRALPQFCSAQVPHCEDDSDGAMSPVRAAVRDVILSVGVAERDGRSMLRLRAGIEALGATKSGEQSDVDMLVRFLDHPSRDIRYATARALRELCIQTAITPLRNRYDQETVDQVRLAISAALGDLAQCSP